MNAKQYEEQEQKRQVGQEIMQILGCTAEMLVDQYKPVAEALMTYLFGNLAEKVIEENRIVINPHIMMWNAVKSTPARNYWLKLCFRELGIGATYEKLELTDSEKIRAMAEILGGRDA